MQYRSRAHLRYSSWPGNSAGGSKTGALNNADVAGPKAWSDTNAANGVTTTASAAASERRSRTPLQRDDGCVVRLIETIDFHRE
jgi:hypothetical protein